MGRTLSRTGAFVALWRQLRASRHGGPGIGRRLGALPRMVGATLRRRYDGGWRLTGMALALAYVVWPVDFVPELLLGPIGLGDDAFVVTWLAGAVLSETGRFLEWERQRRAVIPGQVRPSQVSPGQVSPGQVSPGQVSPGAQITGGSTPGVAGSRTPVRGGKPPAPRRGRRR